MPEGDSRVLFDECYKRLWSEIVAYAINRVGVNDAADVAQEVFAVVDRRWTDAPSEPHDLRLWVFGIARRTCANHLRTQRRLESLRSKLTNMGQSNEALPDEVPFAAAIASEILMTARLRSPEDAELLILMLEERAIPEIAGILGLSVSATNSRIHRLRKHLRQQLPDLWTNEEAAGGIVQ